MPDNLPRTTGVARRSFLKLLAGAAAASWAPRSAAAAPTMYRVGVGGSSDAYTATQRAVAASGEWPAARISGNRVLIKTNLVFGLPTESGATTSPDVVRALVDLALGAGASSVAIIEGGMNGAPFSQCGYDFFNTYDPQGRVSLVDLSQQPAVLDPVPSGLVFKYLYMPQLTTDPSAVFVSAAKLKTHLDAGASLSMKNVFGVPPIKPYFDPTANDYLARHQLHDRGVHQSIIDLNLARPIDFAVVDGIWGMEGPGPIAGTPVEMDLVVAGRNPLAVDRVSLDAMGITPDHVQYFMYATLKGLGPSSMSQIQLAGDPYTPGAFQEAADPPQVWMPRARPASFSPGAGQTTTVSYALGQAGLTNVQVLRVTDLQPSLTVVRTLQDWAPTPAGTASLVWDGRTDAGDVVAPGTYGVRAQAEYSAGGIFNSATGWVVVT